MHIRSKKLVLFMSMVALVLVELPQFSGTAEAAPVPQFSTVAVRLDKLTASTFTGTTVCIATPVSTGGITDFGSENYVDVGFPEESGVVSGATDFQVSTTTANWITTTTPPASPGVGSQYWPKINIGGTLVAASAWPTIGATATAATNTAYTVGNARTLRVVRFTTGNMVANKVYCFDIADGSGTPGAETSGTASLETSAVGTNGYQENVPGYVETYDCSAACGTVGAGTPVESSNWGTQITANNSIVVSAVVPPILVIIFGANVDSFPTNLDPNSVKTTTGVGVTVETNAKGGWLLWIKSKNQALTSASSGGSIPSVGWNADTPTTLVAGTPGYNLTSAVTTNVNGAGTTLCTAQPEAEYAGVLASFQGGELTPNWELAADCSTSTPPGTDAGTTVTLNESAAISFSIPAASDYTDTIFVTGAGQF